MRPIAIFTLSTLAEGAFAVPTASASSSPYVKYMKGFKDPIIRSSVGGHAICIEGTIDVKASAEVTHIKIEQPKDQIQLTNLILEYTQINSTLSERISGGERRLSGTYGIYSQICLAPTTTSSHTAALHFLIHGGGFDRLYWDNAEGY